MKKLIVFTNFGRNSGLSNLMDTDPFYNSADLMDKKIMSLRGNSLIAAYIPEEDSIFLLSDEIDKNLFIDFMDTLIAKGYEIYILWHRNNHNGKSFEEKDMFEGFPNITKKEGKHIRNDLYEKFTDYIYNLPDFKDKWEPTKFFYSPEQVNEIINAIFIDEANKKLEDNLYTLHKELEAIYGNTTLNDEGRKKALQELAKKRDDLFNEGNSKK